MAPIVAMEWARNQVCINLPYLLPTVVTVLHLVSQPLVAVPAAAVSIHLLLVLREILADQAAAPAATAMTAHSGPAADTTQAKAAVEVVEVLLTILAVAAVPAALVLIVPLWPMAVPAYSAPS